MSRSRTKPVQPVEIQFDAAIAMAKEGKHREAINVLEGLMDIAGTDHHLMAACHRYLGGIHLHELDDANRAEGHFRAALALFPRAERTSLGLFHSLMSQGRAEEALTEARRLLSLRPSEEYSRLLVEILEGAGDDEDPVV